MAARIRRGSRSLTPFAVLVGAALVALVPAATAANSSAAASPARAARAALGARAESGAPRAAGTARPLSGGVGAGPAPPTQVFDPYFESWASTSLAGLARRSGDRFFTVAFLESPRHGSCAVDWNGQPTSGVTSGPWATAITALRKLGGDAYPSFGGYSADSSGRDIADSCTNVADIARAYEQVVSAYGSARIDLDVEANALGDTAGIARRSEAIRLLELWAKAHHRALEVQLTLPSSETGLDPRGLAVVKSAVAHGAVVSVNLMVFDYYDGTTRMAAAAASAATGAHGQLASLERSKSSGELWAALSLTIMNGLDDNPNRKELTSVSDAAEIETFAVRHGLGALSMWAIQRDNGGCPGQVGRDDCSGVAEAPWAFSHVLAPFTSSRP